MNQRKRAANRIDMTGNIYNSWKIIEIDHERTKGKVVYWKAQCIEEGCNTIHTVHGPNVRNGLSKRCLDCGNKVGHDKQKGTIRTGKTAEEMAYHYLSIDLKKNATKRKLEWNLSLEEIIILVSGNCVYCGTAPTLVCYPLRHHGLSQKNMDDAIITRNGIDRVDSLIGYNPANTVSCCKVCNIMKTNMGVEVFLDHVAKITDFQRSKK